MLRLFMIATMFGALALSYSTQSWAVDQGQKKLSQNERKALKVKNEKLGSLSSMCIGSLAIAALNDDAVWRTQDYQNSKSFWEKNFSDSTRHAKPRKIEKLQCAYRSAGNAALTQFGNGDIMAGGQKAGLLCSQIEAEGLDGPTATKMIEG